MERLQMLTGELEKVQSSQADRETLSEKGGSYVELKALHFLQE